MEVDNSKVFLGGLSVFKVLPCLLTGIYYGNCATITNSSCIPVDYLDLFLSKTYLE